MKITFLGTGTSLGVPMIGCRCEVCRSTDPRDQRLRTSVVFEIGNFCGIIDTGPDFRQQMLQNELEQLHAILYTHHHQDHVIGLDDIRPFNIWSGQSIPIYATDLVEQNLRRIFSYALSENPYPSSPKLQLHHIEPLQDFWLNDQIKVTPIPVTHGDLSIVGFRINNFTYITDASHISPQSMDRIRGSDILVLNALRHEPHWSHFNLQQAITIAQELQIPQTYLTHISHQLGKHALVSQELPDRVFLAHDGLMLEC